MKRLILKAYQKISNQNPISVTSEYFHDDSIKKLLFLFLNIEKNNRLLLFMSNKVYKEIKIRDL